MHALIALELILLIVSAAAGSLWQQDIPPFAVSGSILSRMESRRQTMSLCSPLKGSETCFDLPVVHEEGLPSRAFPSPTTDLKRREKEDFEKELDEITTDRGIANM